jgi:hypothetical protein
LERKGKEEIGLKLANIEGDIVGFFKSGLITAVQSSWGKVELAKQQLTKSERKGSNIVVKFFNKSG